MPPNAGDRQDEDALGALVYRIKAYPVDSKESLTELVGAYLVGSDGVPVRGEVKLVNGEIRCETRNKEPFGVSLLWPVKGFGAVQLQTTRLPPRDEPYHLQVELARHQLMRISFKREEWGLFDYPGMEEISEQITRSRDLFIQSLECSGDPRQAARLADESIAQGLWAAEKMGQFHAGIFLQRRQQSGGFTKPYLGVAAPPLAPRPELVRQMAEVFDSVRIPFVWRQIQPKEAGENFDHIDAWIKSAGAAKLALRGGPLLNFGVQFVPDWMYLYENDFDSILDNAREHVQRTLQRFGKNIPTWIVASGLHTDNVFGFSFEQTMELTRMATGVAKQVVPRAQVVVDLTQPWGEYYARNMQSIPPAVYADMLVQAGVSFDAFGLQFLFGIGSDGYHVRDLLQVSSLIDKLANLGKPLHITGVSVPSQPAASVPAGGGQWRTPWSEKSQAEWIGAFCEIALSKPYVESVSLNALLDDPSSEIPSGGALHEDGSPKPVMRRLAELRKRISGAETPK